VAVIDKIVAGANGEGAQKLASQFSNLKENAGDVQLRAAQRHRKHLAFATVANRPVPVGGHPEMIATEQPFAACGRLGLFG
jgi:hypothetical protein